MGGPFQEMGAAAQQKKPPVNPWSRGKSDRFNGPQSMNQKAYAHERTKSPAPAEAKPRPPPRQVTPKRARAASVVKSRPSTAPPAEEAAPQRTHVSPERSTVGLDSAKGSARAAAAASSAFAPNVKGRFDVGPGSFYASTPGAATPGVGSFHPDDGPNAFGKSKSPGGSRPKPSPGMAPTSKGRFDAGAGSIYGTPNRSRPSGKKKAPPPSEHDAEVDEWCKRLGLGAVAGAKAAPVLKAVDEARAAAETRAAEAEAEKQQAEAAAAEAVRKAEWMTNRAQERVVHAEERCASAENEASAARKAHDELWETLDELRAEAAAARAEAEALRTQVSKAPRKASPKADTRVIDRRPVRLRGVVDADAEANAARVEARKAKREEHWKRVEAERVEKEERVRQEQLTKSKVALSGRRPASSERSRAGQPPPPLEALKALALVLPSVDRGALSGARLDDEGASGRSSALPEHPLGLKPASNAGSRRAAEPSKSPTRTSPAKPAKPSAAELPSASKQRPVAPPAAPSNGVDDAEDDDAAHSRAPPPPPSHLAIGTQLDLRLRDGGEGGSADSRPTGMCSLTHSPLASATTHADSASDSPVALCLRGRAGVAAPAPFVKGGDDDAFEAAEAQAERMVREEARKASDAAADAHAARRRSSGSRPSLDSQQLGADADLAADLSDAGDLSDNAPHAAASAALKAVLGEQPAPPGQLFARESSFSGGLRLSESFGALPHDDFLSRLAKAEETPASPGGMKARLLPPSRVSAPSPALFSRGVGAC